MIAVYSNIFQFDWGVKALIVVIGGEIYGINLSSLIIYILNVLVQAIVRMMYVCLSYVAV